MKSKSFVLAGILGILALLLISGLAVAAEPPVWDVKSKGAISDGATDNTTLIQNLVNTAPAGSVLYFSSGTYLVNGPITINKSITLAGEPGAVINCAQAAGDVFRLNPNGYAAATTLLTANANAGSNILKVKSTSGYKVGDYIKVFDDETIEGFKKGEIVQISKISYLTLTVSRNLDGTYTRTRKAGIRKLTMVPAVKFTGLSFVGPGVESNPVLIQAYCLNGFEFTGCAVRDFGLAAVALTDCLNARISNSGFDNVFKTGFGYSVVLGNACDNITIEACRFTTRGRHYIATGASSGTYLAGGFPRSIQISNCSFSDSTDEAINTHSPFAGPMTITNCSFQNCLKGVEITNGKCLISGNQFSGCSIAVELFGQQVSFTIQNNGMQNNQRGIRVQSANTVISGNTLENTPIVLLSAKNTQISGNTISGLPANVNPIEVAGASTNRCNGIKIENNRFEQNAGADAVKAYLVDNLNLRGNLVNYSGSFFVDTATTVTMTENTSQFSNSYGIVVARVQGGSLIGNTIQTPTHTPGIYVVSSSGVVESGNNLI